MPLTGDWQPFPCAKPRFYNLRMMNNSGGQTMYGISLDAAEVMTGVSRRTLWRRVAEGVLGSAPKDARGRATVAWGDIGAVVQAFTGLTFTEADCHTLCRADGGDAPAQAALGTQLLAAAAAAPDPAAVRTAARYWLQLAAQHNEADAQHWLALLAAQSGTQQGNHEALMWLAKAAAQGHGIAQRQVGAVLEAGGVPPVRA